MNRFISVICSMFLLSVSLCACSHNSSTSLNTDNANKTFATNSNVNDAHSSNTSTTISTNTEGNNTSGIIVTTTESNIQNTETFTTTSQIDRPTQNNHVTQCSHYFLQATCEQPSKCDKCGIIQGGALGHNYGDKFCLRCNQPNPGYVPVEKIYLEYSQKVITVGDTFKLNYLYSPKNATVPTITFNSSQPNIASVDNNGVVTGVSKGNATITIMTDNGISYSCNIVVKEDLISKCGLTFPSLPLEVAYRSYTKASIENITYSFQEKGNGKVHLTFSLSGKKTYDSKGQTGTTSCIIQWKLYDSNNVVVDSGYVDSPSVSVGEKFANCSDYATDLEPGMYRIEFYS